MVKVLTETRAPREEFRAEILRALLSNAPAAMQYTEQYGLCPTEVRALFDEALLLATGNLRVLGPDLPILAKPPAELCRKSAAELTLLLGDYAGDTHIHEC